MSMEGPNISDKKVLCFGELLLRMSPRLNSEWINENNIATHIGGAELNVARALAKWHIPSKYITALPNHSLSKDLVLYLQEKSIDTSFINFSGSRVGIYFLPQGSDLKNAGVIYDRAYSSFSELKPGMIDWDKALSDVFWVHLSAISPALNQNVTAVCKELLNAASKKGITISLDLNYRSKLWNYGKKPDDVLPELAQYCDLIMGNIWAAEKLLGIPLKEKLVRGNNKKDFIEHSGYTSEAIIKEFPKVKNVANTFRFDKADGSINYYATLYTKKKLYASDDINAADIKDKIGSGDCFMAGLIYGFYNRIDPEKMLSFSTAAAVGKMYETNDATNQTVQHILFNTKVKNGMQKMNKGQKSLDIILRQGILPLYFHASEEVSVNILRALYAAGIRAVEYTNRGKEALVNFKALISVRDSEMTEMHLGIGTIKNASDARAFIKAGADFIISPGLVSEVAKAANEAEVLWIPGCMTVTEISEAERLGAKFVKLFPGNLLGPSYVSTIKDVFPAMSFMPTGGVELNQDNIKEWFKAGVAAVGLGSKLISKDLCEQKNYKKIETITAGVLSVVQSIKNKKV
jgi:2-dehydro-3-deoxygluconokinase